MPKKIEAVENGAYRIRHLKVDVEVGNSKVAGFKPKLRLNRWGGECFIDLDFMPEGLEEEEIEEETDAEGNITKIKWKIKTADDEMEFEFYPVDPREEIVVVNGREHRFLQCDEGGVEWKPVFKKKPKKLVWSFPIQTEGLRYAVQPSLHPDHPTWNDRSVCPENVVGSYAFYHATKKNNEYMTGKAFHLSYPYLEDAEGWKVRAEDFRIENGMLTITLPQDFLNGAVYPVMVDPDLGYTAIGALTAAIGSTAGSNRAGSAWTMPVTGTANYMRAYLQGAGPVKTPNVKAFINQKDSGGAGNHGQIATKENLNDGWAPHWEEFTLAGEVLTSGITYILSVLSVGDLPTGIFYVKYDVNGAVASYYESQTYGAPENPWVVNPEGTTNDYSIFVNYTVAAAEGGGLRMILGLRGHMGYDMKTRGGKARRRMW